MPIGLIGRKCGMTRVFTEQGASVPVTVIEVAKNLVTQLKTVDNDGYVSVQLTTGNKKSSKVNKAQSGHYAKADVAAGLGLWEFRVSEKEQSDLKLGSEISVNIFKVGQIIDVTATSKGKGFAGVIKRHNFSSQRNSHGNSLAHRAPGSIGQNQTPGRVFKGKKMAGQLGNVKTTVQNLEVFRIDADKGLLLIRGSVPGAPGGYVTIKPAVKKSNVA